MILLGKPLTKTTHLTELNNNFTQVVLQQEVLVGSHRINKPPPAEEFRKVKRRRCVSVLKSLLASIHLGQCVRHKEGLLSQNDCPKTALETNPITTNRGLEPHGRAFWVPTSALCRVPSSDKVLLCQHMSPRLILFPEYWEQKGHSWALEGTPPLSYNKIAHIGQSLWPGPGTVPQPFGFIIRESNLSIILPDPSCKWPLNLSLFK